MCSHTFPYMRGRMGACTCAHVLCCFVARAIPPNPQLVRFIALAPSTFKAVIHVPMQASEFDHAVGDTRES